MTTRVADHSGQDLTGELINSPEQRDGGNASQNPGRSKGKKRQQGGTAESTEVWLPCLFRIGNKNYYKDVTINCLNQTYNGVSDLK
jgi:hypothetical protein